jgi:hypothetical protein
MQRQRLHWFARIGYAALGLLFLMLAYFTVAVRDRTAWLLARPAGQWLIGAGLIVLASGIAEAAFRRLDDKSIRFGVQTWLPT